MHPFFLIEGRSRLGILCTGTYAGLIRYVESLNRSYLFILFMRSVGRCCLNQEDIKDWAIDVLVEAMMRKEETAQRSLQP